MNTNAIKAFAKAARLKLLDGVESRLKYWGINENATVVEEPEATYGGYIFRGKVFTGTTAMDKWKRLQSKIKDKQAVKDVIEEAAYTWFNRLIAIKILEKNGYIPMTTGYENNDKTPAIVQEAKKGNYKPVKNSDQKNLLEYLDENDEEKAFGLLITDFCNKHPLLKEVFGRINDYTELLIPNNLLTNNGLIEMINTTEAITDEDYKQVELIGWLYQFYISDRKDEVFAGFKNNKKARPEDIPAATQIFTPKWIVKYMVENTVGKIWLDYNPSSMIRKEMKYLVENEDDKNNEPIISGITELTLMDPACGSGHILVEGFDLLIKMYLEEGYTRKNAVLSILENNLYGLEIDDRAAQLARFALLLKAASYYPEIINLPPSETKKERCNIHAFPEPTVFTTDELLTVIGQEGRPFLNEIKETLDLLQQGKNIGSALKLNLSERGLKYIEGLFQKEHSFLVWQRLKSFLEIIISLSGKYHAVAANPPYMGNGNMNIDLKSYLEINYSFAKYDLYSTFILVAKNLSHLNGITGIIAQQSWMFTYRYEKLRENVIKNFSIKSVLHLGVGTFGADFGTASFNFCNSKSFLKDKVNFFDLSRFFNVNLKEKNFLRNEHIKYNSFSLEDFEKIPKKIFAYRLSQENYNLFKNKNYLSRVATTREGLTTGDNERFLRFWQEISILKFRKKWFPYIKGGDFRKWYGNLEYILNWEDDGNEIKNNKTLEGRVRSHNYNGKFGLKEGLSWSAFSSKEPSFRYVSEGCYFDSKGSMLFLHKNTKIEVPIVLAYLNSKVSLNFLESISENRDTKPGTISDIPFKDLTNDQYVYINKTSKEIIGFSKKDWDSQETSWDFEKSPLLNGSLAIKKAFQNWLEDVICDFFQFHTSEEKLNRIFIDIFGLQEELTPEVLLKNITILQEELDRDALEKLEKTFRDKGENAIQLPIKKDVVISQFLSYCIGIMLGRYRLDKPGLNIAHPKPTEEELTSYNCNNYKVEIDDDAIIPFMGLESAFPDDVVSRVKHLLIAIWGEETLTDNLNFIREYLGMDLERWLTEKFWTFHVRMYKKRPIYWLFASDPKYPQAAAFKVLVYMHRMDKYTVHKIRHNYLHPHQGWIKREIEKLKEDEAGLSREDQKRLTRLQQFELECSDYDEILKELANRQIEIDLDDGVKVNIEKFKPAVAKI